MFSKTTWSPATARMRAVADDLTARTEAGQMTWEPIGPGPRTDSYKTDLGGTLVVLAWATAPGGVETLELVVTSRGAKPQTAAEASSTSTGEAEVVWAGLVGLRGAIVTSRRRAETTPGLEALEKAVAVKFTPTGGGVKTELVTPSRAAGPADQPEKLYFVDQGRTEDLGTCYFQSAVVVAASPDAAAARAVKAVGAENDCRRAAGQDRLAYSTMYWTTTEIGTFDPAKYFEEYDWFVHSTAGVIAINHEDERPSAVSPPAPAAEHWVFWIEQDQEQAVGVEKYVTTAAVVARDETQAVDRLVEWAAIKDTCAPSGSALYRDRLTVKTVGPVDRAFFDAHPWDYGVNGILSVMTADFPVEDGDDDN